MRNETFPTYQNLIEELKLFFHNSRIDYLEEKGEVCQTNLLGSLIEAGYDVLSDVRISERYTCDLLVRVAEGFVVVELAINPNKIASIKEKVDQLWNTLGQYKDIQSGYFVAIMDEKNDIGLDMASRHPTKVDKLYWWGGRLSRSHDNAEGELLPIWNKNKLSLYRIRKERIIEGEQ